MQNAILPKAVKNSLRGLTSPSCFVKLILDMEASSMILNRSG